MGIDPSLTQSIIFFLLFARLRPVAGVGCGSIQYAVAAKLSAKPHLGVMSASSSASTDAPVV